MRPLVIYHASCADGFGAAFAAWLKLGDDADYLPMQYGQTKLHEALPFNPLNRDVYILDFSFERQIMEFIFKDALHVVWLDHHKSSFETWCPTEREWYETDDGTIVLNNSKSGAYLAWEYFHPCTEIPLFIRHIDDYDRWQFKIEGTKAFNKALWSYAPWSFKQWDTGLGLLTGIGVANCYPEGEAILRAHNQNVQSVVKGAAR